MYNIFLQPCNEDCNSQSLLKDDAEAVIIVNSITVIVILLAPNVGPDKHFSPSDDHLPCFNQ